MNQPLVTIIVSTYNGEKYIIEQLDSLRNQTYENIEVIFRDDMSTDNTVSVISKYIEDYRLCTWTLHINKCNIGWEKNFVDGFLFSNGKYIFPCDQDDIWNPDKVTDMVACMENDCSCNVLCSDYSIIYMDNAVRYPKTKVSKLLCDGSIEKVKFGKSLFNIDRPGCTMCIRRSFLDTMMSMIIDRYPHDALAWRSALITESLYILHKAEIQFRRHGNNASDKNDRTVSERYDLAKYYLCFLVAIEKWASVNLSDLSKKKFIEKSIHVQEKRIDALMNGRMIKMIGLIVYIKFYPSFRSYIADVISISKW